MHIQSGPEEVFRRMVSWKRGLLDLLERSKAILGPDDRQLASWNAALAGLNEDVAGKLARVSVIGSVKSGKSTFCNYFLGEDILKRGAGIITSIVTRVRFGDRLSAELLLKGLNELHGEIADALEFLDPGGQTLDGERFRLEDAESRRRMASFLDGLSTQADTDEEFVKQTTRLRAILEGYPKAASILRPEEARLTLVDREAESHRDFVGHESMAVFLQEALITLPTHRLPPGVEIGDCQGSDSPNPAHMAAVLEYLLSSHFVIYLVSSRTGIRAADIKLIQTLKAVQLSNEIFFVFNVDLGEHEDRPALEEQLKRTESDLNHLGVEPRIYAFSALYHLLKTLPEGELSEKDRIRMQFWEQGGSLVAFSEGEEKRFRADFGQLLERERYDLQIRHGQGILNQVASGMEDVLYLRQAWMNRTMAEIEETLAGLSGKQEAIRDTAQVLRNALDGIRTKIDQDLKAGVDRLLDPRSGEAVLRMRSFVADYPTLSGSQTQSASILRLVMLYYARLSEGLQRYIQEEFNPRIIEYARGKEAEIRLGYEQHVMTYVQVLQGLLESFHAELNRLSGSEGNTQPALFSMTEKSRWDPKLFRASFHFRVRARARVFLQLGWGKTVQSLRQFALRLLRRDAPAGGDASRIVSDCEAVIRDTITDELLEQLADYRENLKYGFFLKVSELVSERLYEEVRRYLDTHLLDLSNMKQRVRDQERSKASQSLEASHLLDELRSLRREIGTPGTH